MSQLINRNKNQTVSDGLPGFRIINSYRNKNHTGDGLPGFRISNNYGGNDMSDVFYLTKTFFKPNLSDNQFGYSVDISGTQGIVGVYDTVNLGHVFFYDVSGTGEPILLSDVTNGVAGDLFGSAVAISGNKAIVGAQNHQVGSNAGQGNAYYYNLASLPYVATELTASNGTSNDQFGYSVDISSTRALVGARLNDFTNANTTDNQGSVYVYNVSGATPVFITELTASDGSIGDVFGTCVALDKTNGLRAAVGAPRKNTARGAVYLYDLSASSGPYTATELTSSTATVSDLFGSSVAISGNLLIVGQDDENASRGKIYIYDITTLTAPVLLAQITDPGATDGDHFGHSVSIDGTRAIIGSYGYIGGSEAGSAYIYDLTTPSSPILVKQIFGNDGDDSGWSVAISGTKALIGSPVANSSQGSVTLVSNLQ